MVEKRSVRLSAFIVIVGIFLSRIFGFFREMLTANIFGMGYQTDAFYAAFTIPDIMYNMLIGGTMSAAFIPIFTSYLAKEKEDEAWKVASNFINVVFCSLFGVTILGMIFTPYIVPLVAYNFKGVQLELTIRLTRIMFSAVAFTCLAGMGIGILQSYHKFFAAVFGPVVYNLGIITSLLLYKFLHIGNGIQFIAYGVVISAFINFLLQALALSSKLKFYEVIFNPKDSELKRIFKLAIPTIIGLSIVQINYAITQNFASGLSNGSITAFKYSNILMLLPVGIFAMGIATAIFPTLTTQVALNNREDYKGTFSLGIRTIFFITIPSAVGLFVLSQPIVRLLFSSGQFNEENVRMTAFALEFFCIAIVFQSGMQIITRGFYSVNDTLTPVKVGFLTVILNIVLNYLLVKFLPLKYPVGCLVLATSIYSMVNMITLSIILSKKLPGIFDKRLLTSTLKTCIASIIMGIVIYIGLENIHFKINSKVFQATQVGSLMILGLMVFGICSLMLKMEEGQYFWRLFTSRLKFLKRNKEMA